VFLDAELFDQVRYLRARTESSHMLQSSVMYIV